MKFVAYYNCKTLSTQVYSIQNKLLVASKLNYNLPYKVCYAGALLVWGPSPLLMGFRGGLRGAPALETTSMLLLLVVVSSMMTVDDEAMLVLVLVLLLFFVTWVDDKEASEKRPKKLMKMSKWETTCSFTQLYQYTNATDAVDELLSMYSSLILYFLYFFPSC